MQISGTPPEIACWRHWPFIELIGTRLKFEKSPVQISGCKNKVYVVLDHYINQTFFNRGPGYDPEANLVVCFLEF